MRDSVKKLFKRKLFARLRKLRSMSQTTPFYAEHKACGAKFIDFHGWKLPAQFDSSLKEHHHVRNACGIFDISHMGELLVTGEQACEFLQFATSNDLTKLKPNHAQYSLLLNDKGGIRDDLIVYCRSEHEYFLCVNAANQSNDEIWLQEIARKFRVELRNLSMSYAQIAVQGPKSHEVLKAFFEDRADVNSQLSMLRFNQFFDFDEQSILLARTGYTGELGYELYIAWDKARPYWQKLLENNLVKPCGLASRDTLRLEACYPLHGNDIDETTTPYEANLGWTVKLDKKAFVGKEALTKEKAKESERKLVAFKMLDRAIARKAMKVYSGSESCGHVTSGTQLPSLGFAGGLAYVTKEMSQPGTKLEVDVRGKRKEACIVKRPFYSSRANT